MTTKVLEPDRVKEIAFKGGVNTPDDVILAQVQENIRRGLPQAQAHPPNNQHLLIVGGGPSLKTTEKELVEAVWRGGKVVALNGAYQWCIDRNIMPSAMVMLDAREFNTRFVETPVEGCHYLLASQCHPRAFELCRNRQVTIWQAMSAHEKEEEILNEYYFNNYHPVTIGTTVAIRTISLMRMLGFMRHELFGVDSCHLGDEHHAYEQAENNGEKVLSVWLRPRTNGSGFRDDKAIRFICSAWQAKQAEDFMQLIKNRGDLFELSVHGPGLIATMIKTGFEIHTEEH